MKKYIDEYIKLHNLSNKICISTLYSFSEKIDKFIHGFKLKIKLSFYNPSSHNNEAYILSMIRATFGDDFIDYSEQFIMSQKISLSGLIREIVMGEFNLHWPRNTPNFSHDVFLLYLINAVGLEYHDLIKSKIDKVKIRQNIDKYFDTVNRLNAKKKDMLKADAIYSIRNGMSMVDFSLEEIIELYEIIKIEYVHKS